MVRFPIPEPPSRTAQVWLSELKQAKEECLAGQALKLTVADVVERANGASLSPSTLNLQSFCVAGSCSVQPLVSHRLLLTPSYYSRLLVVSWRVCSRSQQKQTTAASRLSQEGQRPSDSSSVSYSPASKSVLALAARKFCELSLYGADAAHLAGLDPTSPRSVDAFLRRGVEPLEIRQIRAADYKRLTNPALFDLAEYAYHFQENLRQASLHT